MNMNNYLTLAILGGLLLVALIVGVVILAGLFKARSLLRREFAAYFLSPIAYVVLVVFLVVTGHRFYPVWTAYSILLLGGLAGALVGLLFMILPVDTRGRLFGLSLFVAGVVCAGVGGWQHYHLDPEHTVDLHVTAGIDPMPVISSYLGLFLAGAMFLAIGLLVSSLVRSQMVAALLSLVVSLVFIVAGFWRPDMDTSSLGYQVLHFFSVPLHFSRDFTRGLIDTRHLGLYGSVALFCLFLTVRSLESRRWR